MMSQTILPAARIFFGLPLKDDGINGNGDDQSDGGSASDGTYRCWWGRQAPRAQLTAWKLSLGVCFNHSNPSCACNGCANNVNNANFLQNLSQFSTSINAYCIKCGSLGSVEAVCSCQMRLQALCAMHYARKLCKGRGVHTFSYRDVCIVSWPGALAGGVTMIVITVQPITWPDHHPSRPSSVHCTTIINTKTWCTQIQRQ